ncbi:hypothetical protein NY751_21890 [Xanthomonas campestris]|nr:hypothetical protein [Xanthomonas campestris]MDC8748648.1 hypothetical protein [Xanthomonas campestris]
MRNTALQVDGQPDRIRHDDGIGKDPVAAKQHVALSRHKFHRAERAHKLLQRTIQRHQPGRPIAQHLRRVTQSAGVPLMCSRERTPARRASPRLFHGDPGD